MSTNPSPLAVEIPSVRSTREATLEDWPDLVRRFRYELNKVYRRLDRHLSERLRDELRLKLDLIYRPDDWRSTLECAAAADQLRFSMTTMKRLSEEMRKLEGVLNEANRYRSGGY